MFKEHFSQTVVTILALVIGFIMAVCACFVDHIPLNFGNVYKLWGMISLTVLLVSIFLPYKAWSEKVLSILPVQRETFLFKLLDNIIPTLVLNTCITILVSGANILFNEAIPEAERVSEWVSTMLHDWPITFVISYFAAFFAEACGVWVARRNGRS